MTIVQKCQICHNDLRDTDRVIFSHKETFVFKPAEVPDIHIMAPDNDGALVSVNLAATMTPDELRESRKEHLKTTVVNTFCDWGKATVPSDAFYFRHQWCEPVRTGAGAEAHPITKHAIRFARMMTGRARG